MKAQPKLISIDYLEGQDGVYLCDIQVLHNNDDSVPVKRV